jgi:hypothetical protein
MSWLSRTKNAFVNLVAGQPADTQIVLNPTTPIEKLMNAAAPPLLQAAAKAPGANNAAATIASLQQVIHAGGPSAAGVQTLVETLERDSGVAAKAFINAEIGPALGGLADLGAQALAAAAIGEISQFKNVPAQTIADALDNFLDGLKSTTAPAPAAPAAAPVAAS